MSSKDFNLLTEMRELMRRLLKHIELYSTVTDFAKFLG